MTENKWKLVGLDRALDGVPPEERDSVAAAIQEMFRDFDPENAPGEAVIRVDPGTRVCPFCGGPLVELALLPRPDDNPNHELILECDSCDGTFSGPVEQDPN
jgi:hypothetical protein